MPMSDVQPRDHKVLLAILAHTVAAVGMSKDSVGISIVQGTLGAVQSLLIVVRVRSVVPTLPDDVAHPSLTWVLGHNRQPA